MTKNTTPRGKDVWIVICEEYLVLKETKKDLTIKGFCNMRDSVNYNTARVRMPKILKELSDRSKQDQRKILPDGTKAREHSGKTHSEYLARPESSKTKGHSIYSKYFDPELLDLAAQGTLDDDLLLYRSKALEALDYMVKLRADIDDAAEASSKNPNNESLEKKVKALEARLSSSDKALSWCITRIENIAMTIKKIELTSVMIVKERANVVKTKAVTRATLHQSNKYKADTKLAKARAYELEHGNKGDVATDIVKDLQSRRDLLPSFAKQQEATK